MAAITLLRIEAAEACFWLANSLSKMLYCKPNDIINLIMTCKHKHKIIIECFTDNHQLCNCISSIKPIQDNCLQIEIPLLRKMLNRNEVTKFNWTEKQYQLADSHQK